MISARYASCWEEVRAATRRSSSERSLANKRIRVRRGLERSMCVDRRYQGKLQTVLDQRDVGHPVLRWYYETSFAKQYTRGDRHGDCILRNETTSNDTRHFGIGRRLENLPLLREKLAATNERCLALQAEVLASTVDTGQLAWLAQPTVVGQRRIPGLKLHDDRVIRVLETLLHPAAFAGDWTTRELHTRILARHQLAETDYRPSQP